MIEVIQVDKDGKYHWIVNTECIAYLDIGYKYDGYYL